MCVGIGEGNVHGVRSSLAKRGAECLGLGGRTARQGGVATLVTGDGEGKWAKRDSLQNPSDASFKPASCCIWLCSSASALHIRKVVPVMCKQT